jgi:hypothetical protein
VKWRLSNNHATFSQPGNRIVQGVLASDNWTMGELLFVKSYRDGGITGVVFGFGLLVAGVWLTLSGITPQFCLSQWDCSSASSA